MFSVYTVYIQYVDDCIYKKSEEFVSCSNRAQEPLCIAFDGHVRIDQVIRGETHALAVL